MARVTYSDEPRDIWIVAETKDGALTPLTKELVYGARTAADMMGFYVRWRFRMCKRSGRWRVSYIPSVLIACMADDDRPPEFG
jgi:hypothetical protein